MSRDHYERALHAALREYEQAIADRAALDTRLAHLQQTIGTLSRLCGFAPTVTLGLTEACRMVLRSAGQRLTALEVRDRLAAFGFDVAKYANSLAAIHTVLKRLVEAGELGEADRDEHTKTAYEFLAAGVIASRTGPGPAWMKGGKAPGVGLCPPKDRPSLAKTAKTRRRATRERSK